MATPAQAGTANVSIPAPNIKELRLIIEGTAPLVMERFSKKAELMAKMSEGAAAKNKRTRTARDYAAEAQEAKHIDTRGGWDGINASAFRNASISACRLVGFKMTLAKLCLHVLADGLNVDGEPLVRLYGESEVHTAHTRNATGVADVRSRPMYREWAAAVRVCYDADQFTQTDIVNLFSRVGAQVGIGAGRPDSKQSAGCGWGTFRIAGQDIAEGVIARFGIGKGA